MINEALASAQKEQAIQNYHETVMMKRKKTEISHCDSLGIHDRFEFSNNLIKQGQVNHSDINEINDSNGARKKRDKTDININLFNDSQKIENEKAYGSNNDLNESDLKMRKAWEKVIQIRNCHSATKNENNTICDEKYLDEKEEDAIVHAMNVTTSVLFEEIENLMVLGMGAFHHADDATNERNKTKEKLETKTKEVNRLQESYTQSRQAVSNLFKALETSKSSTLTSTQKSQDEVQLRTTISELRHKLSLSESKSSRCINQIKLLTEQVSLLKSKLQRLQQEKRIRERDSRAAISFARSMDSSNHVDTNFYKKRVKELCDRLDAQQKKLMGQQNVIDSMKRAIKSHKIG